MAPDRLLFEFTETGIHLIKHIFIYFTNKHCIQCISKSYEATSKTKAIKMKSNEVVEQTIAYYCPEGGRSQLVRYKYCPLPTLWCAVDELYGMEI